MSAVAGLNELPPEVLRIICDLLFRDPPEQIGQGWPYKQSYVGLTAILALTRTSRILHEHALNVLWDTLPGYGCLVFTLPSDAWTIEDKSPRPHQWSKIKTEQHLSIVRPLVDADLLRFRHYAPRVKRIISNSYFLTTFPSRVWSILCHTSVLAAFSTYFRSATGQAPFPNLGVLHLSPTVEDPATYYDSLPVFFNRNLRNIADKCTVMKKHTDFSSYESMLSKLQESSPDLLFFNANFTPWFTTMASALSNALPGFRQLASIQVTVIPLTPQAVLQLATLPNLTDIGFKIDDRCDAESLELFADTSSKNYFHKLRTVSVDHQKNAAIPNIVLRSISSPAVTVIRVSINSFDVRIQEVKELLSTIANRPGHRRLRSVNVTVHGLPEKDTVLDEDDFVPFYKLTNLVELELSVPTRFALTNEVLRSMAMSWRKIRNLQLGPGTFCRRADDDAQPLVTLVGLISFAQLCPNLSSLGLALRPVPGYAHKGVRPSFGRPHRALRNLHVGHSKIEETQVLPAALFLSDVFPKVDIDCDWPFEESAWEDGVDFTEAEREELLAEAVYRDRWNRVGWQLVPALAKVRKQERKWGLANGKSIRTVQVFDDE
ncbi:hypothetical protein GSI_15342 [Ganoderma sinense ZZ0214-1]|uniref:F-box domain-containing protein n=1 Tax=Ganoderma sinense ZZ0214-1 TaxID=1077348 RepID=A0A2G8RMB9_9APHY|nr:hypothetical protein GSI_15342 [Ganoderma sinense ZZ0214-1]